MGNGTVKGLSVNAKTLIIILLFANVGFASKMLSKYYKMKAAGYYREKTFSEQLEKRVMKAFGSVEDLNKIVNDITRQKENAEKVAASFKEQGEQLKSVNKKLEEEKAKVEEEKGRLLKEIWALEDSLAQAKSTLGNKDMTIKELMKNLEAAEKETMTLKKQIEDYSKTPGAWSLPKQ